ncbi:MAG: hypothetical protein JXA10_14920 [Anaerolineae bacterium]|nr:hypothetical protein [Anaerolineae bacterium]
MKNAHQIVKIRIDVIKDDPAKPIYTASNEELGVFVKAASFREMLTELREVLAIRLKGITPSLQFYALDSSQGASPPVSSSGVMPGAALAHSAGRENRIN